MSAPGDQTPDGTPDPIVDLADFDTGAETEMASQPPAWELAEEVETLRSELTPKEPDPPAPTMYHDEELPTAPWDPVKVTAFDRLGEQQAVPPETRVALATAYGIRYGEEPPRSEHELGIWFDKLSTLFQLTPAQREAYVAWGRSALFSARER
jgi:hypothetical protein